MLSYRAFRCHERVLTVSRQLASKSTVNSQKWIFFTINRQECRLSLTVRKFQGTSNIMSVLPEKCQNFRNLEGGEAAAPSPPRPVHLCYLVKLGAGLLSGKKKYNFCVLFCIFFILLMLIWAWINSWKTIAPAVSQMALRQNKS